MKFRKGIMVATLSLSIFTFGTTVNAEENANEVVDLDVTQDVKQSVDGNSLKNSVQAPTNTSKTKVYKPLFNTKYAISSSSSTTLEDYIYARCRVFNANGSQISSTTNDAKAASYTSAKAKNGTFHYGSDWAVGNHIYKLSGYKDVTHETRADW